MKMRSIVLGTALIAVSTGSVVAQGAVPPAPTPMAVPAGPKLTAASAGECHKAGSDWYNKEMTALPAPERNAKRVAYTAEYKRIVQACAAGFNVGNTPASALAGLTDYYVFIGDTANARLSLDRALTATLSDADRGSVLIQAMSREITRAPGYFGILDAAERYVAQIDALPAAQIDRKVAAHQRMLGQYEYLDVADGLQKHATALIDLGRQAKKPGVLIQAFSSLARASADKLHPEDALRILRDAEAELGTTVVNGAYDDFRNRYALIGTAAPKVVGQWWVNSATPISAVDPANGKVTLVEFTAHWCGPCKNSYPGIKKVAQHFAGQPFQGVMVTGLYGFLGQRRPLTQAEEIEADAEYFSKEHAVPFPVAINIDTPPQGARDYKRPDMDRAFRVSGIPQIMIIDRKGVIRQIVTGWDQGNTERFTKYIETLLAEK